MFNLCSGSIKLPNSSSSCLGDLRLIYPPIVVIFNKNGLEGHRNRRKRWRLAERW